MNRTATKLEGLFIVSDIKSPVVPMMCRLPGDAGVSLVVSALRCNSQRWENLMLLNIPWSQLGKNSSELIVSI